MAQNGLQMANMNANMGSNLPMGYVGMSLNGAVNNLTGGTFSCGSVGEGSSGGVGSGGSLNGGNSDDDYDQYDDDDDDDDDDCDEDDDNFNDSQDSDTENKHLLSNGNTNSIHSANIIGSLNNHTTLNNRTIGNVISNTNSSHIPGLSLNGGLSVHDFSVSNMELKNEILIKPDGL